MGCCSRMAFRLVDATIVSPSAQSCVTERCMHSCADVVVCGNCACLCCAWLCSKSDLFASPLRNALMPSGTASSLWAQHALRTLFLELLGEDHDTTAGPGPASHKLLAGARWHEGPAEIPMPRGMSAEKNEEIRTNSQIFLNPLTRPFQACTMICMTLC